MPISPVRLIKNSLELVHMDDMNNLPIRVRGIYVLYKYRPKLDMYDVVYVGMARGEKSGILGRLNAHRKNKANLWSHFSAYEVWDNIREEEIIELEGLFRHIFRKDSQANSLNKQKSYKPLRQVVRKGRDDWKY